MTEILKTRQIWAEFVPCRMVTIEVAIPDDEHLLYEGHVNGFVFSQMVGAVEEALGVHLMGADEWKRYEELNDSDPT